MKAFFIIVITAILIMAGFRFDRSLTVSEASIKPSAQSIRALTYSETASSRCPFFQAGHF